MRKKEKKEEKKQKISKADLIRKVADSFGHHHSNRWICQRVQSEYGVDVLESQVVNTLGKLGYRNRVLDDDVRHYARNLSVACGHDRRLIYRAVQRYCGE